MGQGDGRKNYISIRDVRVESLNIEYRPIRSPDPILVFS